MEVHLGHENANDLSFDASLGSSGVRKLMAYVNNADPAMRSDALRTIG